MDALSWKALFTGRRFHIGRSPAPSPSRMLATTLRALLSLSCIFSGIAAAQDTTPPTAPTGLTITSTTATQISISWTASTDNVGVTQYGVERCQGAGCSAFALITWRSTTIFTNSSLAQGTSYSYRVRAIDAAGNLSAYSNVATSTTGYAPTAPGDLAATAVSQSRVNLTWTAATDDVQVSGYKVERCEGTCSYYVIIATTSFTSYSNSGLQAETSYQYRVRAYDAQGNYGLYSSVASALTLPPDTEAPTAPTGLTATPTAPTAIDLNWTLATDNYGVYRQSIERCQGVDCTDFVVIYYDLLPQQRVMGMTGLQAGTSYSFRVRARDEAGNYGPYSNVASATTFPPDTEPPTAPTGLTATAVSESQINLRWTHSTDNWGVQRYYVERCQGAGCSNFVLEGNMVAVLAESWSMLPAQPGVTYSYRVRAKDSAGNFSDYSNVAIATTLGGPQVYFIHADHVNTPRRIYDQNQQLVWSWVQQEPFGDSPADENPSGLGTFQFDLGFPGHVRNRETGTFYNYYRDCYDPATGRYCQPDPIGLAGGPNPYLYVVDPLTEIDPEGLMGNAPGKGPYAPGTGPGASPIQIVQNVIAMMFPPSNAPQPYCDGRWMRVGNFRRSAVQGVYMITGQVPPCWCDWNCRSCPGGADITANPPIGTNTTKGFLFYSATGGSKTDPKRGDTCTCPRPSPEKGCSC